MNYGKRSTRIRSEKVDSKSTKVRKRFGVILCKVILALLIVFAVIGVCAGLGVYKGIIDSAPDISKLDVVPTGYSTTVLANDGTTPTATLVAAGANRKYVSLDEVPDYMQKAFIATEDARFYDHNGIDLYGIARAGVKGIAKGFHFSEGASTITQQLIKNNVLTSWTSEASKIERLQRKLQEQYLAVELEKQVNNKDWILENYLNTINLGANTLGVEAASEKYFGKSVSELTLSEASVIAGITKNPYKYNPIRFPEKNADRRELVLSNLLDQEYITKDEYNEALADDVYSRIAEHNNIESGSMNSYFVDALIDQLYKDFIAEGYTQSDAYKLIYQSGLTIYSTQDMTMQQIADEAANNPDNYGGALKYSFILYFQTKANDGTFHTYSNQTMLSYLKKTTGNQNKSINYKTEEECYEAIEAYKQAVTSEGETIVEGTESVHITIEPQVALTLADHTTGEVKAMVGGRGDKIGNRTWNRATDTTRQPGSCFKVVGCYAAALDAGGKTLASVEDDAPFTVGTKEFSNWDHAFGGWTTIREAIIHSTNITTVKNLQDISPALGLEYAEKLGITTLIDGDKNLALALGGITNGVKNVDLNAAYSTIANSGNYNEPIFYTKVVDHDGNVLIDKTAIQQKRKVLKDTTSWLLIDAMKEVMTSPRGTGGSAHFNSSIAQAGKSGTTTDDRDSLWAGFTPYYTCTVWGGYDDNSSLGNTGYPMRVWKELMSRIHDGLPEKDFDKPENIVSAEVCAESGLLAIPGVCDQDPRGSRVITEYFDKDSLPTEQCNHHTKLRICKTSGQVAGLFCPPSDMEEKVFVTEGTNTTEDGPYLLTSEFSNQTCTTHNAAGSKPLSGIGANKPTADPANGSSDTTATGTQGGSTTGSTSQHTNGATTSGGTRSNE